MDKNSGNFFNFGVNNVTPGSAQQLVVTPEQITKNPYRAHIILRYNHVQSPSATGIDSYFREIEVDGHIATYPNIPRLLT